MRHEAVVLRFLPMPVVLAALLLSSGAPAQEQRSAEPSRRVRVLQGALKKREAAEEERRKLADEIYRLRERIPLKHSYNIRWRNEAVARETRAVENADRAFDKRQYRKAKKAYQKALSISFEQWVLKREVSSKDIKDEKPKLSLTKRKFRMATEKTAWCFKSLETIDSFIAESDLARLQERADRAFESGKLSLAYLRHGAVLDLARRMRDSTNAAEAAKEAAARRKEILVIISKPLDEIDAALAADDPGEAVDILDKYKEQYESFSLKSAIRARYRSLSKMPAVHQERHRRSAENTLKLGIAAMARKDYLNAEKHFRKGAQGYANTEAGEIAAERLAELEQDAEIMELIQQKRIENKCKALLARGSMLLRDKKWQEALATYDAIINEYPDTEWATKAEEAARKIKESLAPQPERPETQNGP